MPTYKGQKYSYTKKGLKKLKQAKKKEKKQTAQKAQSSLIRFYVENQKRIPQLLKLWQQHMKKQQDNLRGKTH